MQGRLAFLKLMMFGLKQMVTWSKMLDGRCCYAVLSQVSILTLRSGVRQLEPSTINNQMASGLLFFYVVAMLSLLCYLTPEDAHGPSWVHA